MFTHLDEEGLEVESVERAEKKMIWLLQEKYLRKEKDAIRDRMRRVKMVGDCLEKGEGRKKKSKDRLGRLNPFMDEEEIMREGGRLGNAQEDFQFVFRQ